MRERILREESGFTLTELLVTMLLMVTVMFALYSIFDMSIRVFRFGNDKVEATESARVGLEKMSRELRAAYPVNKPAGDSYGYLFFYANDATKTNADKTLAPIQATLNTTQLGPSQVTFGNDLDGNRKVDCPNSAGNCEYITYKLSSSAPYKLLRNNTSTGSLSGSGGDSLAEFVKSDGLTLTYLKSDGTAATSESDVGIVRIKLEISKSSGAYGNRTQTLTTDVALRNRSE